MNTSTMTDEERKSLAIEYLLCFDAGGTSTGGSIMDLLAPNAEVYFPKWGIARGTAEITTMFSEIGPPIRSIRHDISDINWIFSGSDLVVAEGTSSGVHVDGPWRADQPAWGAGRWCDVFEIRGGLIHRVFIYLDPDYAGLDRDRYPWIDAGAR